MIFVHEVQTKISSGVLKKKMLSAMDMCVKRSVCNFLFQVYAELQSYLAEIAEGYLSYILDLMD
jgi:hypothetical protein